MESSNISANDTTISSSSLPDINLFFAISIPPIGFMTLFGNAAVMLAFWKVPGLKQKPSNLLILNLAVSDFIMGLTTLFLLLPYLILSYWPYGEIGCAIGVSLTHYISFVSLSTLCTISVDRVLLVSREYPKYMKIMSRRRVKIIIGLCWTIALSIIVLELSLWQKAKSMYAKAAEIDYNKTCVSPGKAVKAFSLFIFLVFSFIPVLIVAVLSVVFVCLLYRRLRNNQRRVSAVGNLFAEANVTGRRRVSTIGNLFAAVPNATGRRVGAIGNLFAELGATGQRLNTAGDNATTINPAGILTIPGVTGSITAQDLPSCSSSRLHSTNARDDVIVQDIALDPASAARGDVTTASNQQAATDHIGLSKHAVKHRYIKPAVTFAVLVFALGVCQTPYFAYIFVGAFCPSCVAGIDSMSRYILLLLLVSNSLLNPFLYAMTQKKIIRYYRGRLHNAFNCAR